MKPLVWMTFCLAGLSLDCAAGNLFAAAEVSNAQLAELRGRYVLPNSIVHFGVTMSSTWQNSAGQSIGASVGFQVDEHAQPHLYVTSFSVADEVLAPGDGTAGGQVIGGAGLSDVQGVSQSVRSAGDMNDGLNSIEIVVNRSGQAVALPAGAVPWDGSAGPSGAAGVVSISTLGGGLTMQIDAGAQGVALQRIGAGGINQQANFTGNLNTLLNQATINVALREMAMGQGFVNCTLEQLRALRPTGY
jgi:hypothetical protein